MQFSTKFMLTAAILLGRSLALTDDQQQALDLHNDAREAVGVSDLTWDDDLASEAQAWAEKLASANTLEHSESETEGECLWEGYVDSPYANAATDWIAEKSSYNGEAITMSNYMTFGHYTQIVWNTTKKVGMGLATGSDGAKFVVARYDVIGNVIGETPY